MPGTALVNAVTACIQVKQEPQFKQLMRDIHETVTEQLKPDLYEAAQYDNSSVLESLRDQLGMYVELVDAAFKKSGVKQQSQFWIQVRCQYRV